MLEQLFPTQNSFAWRQSEWAAEQMMDPTNPWYGRVAAGVGALASSAYATAERFVLAPLLEGAGDALKGADLALHDALRGIGLSEVDIGSLQLMLWEEEFPAAAAEGLGYLATRADAAVGQLLTPASRLEGGLPTGGATATNLTALGNDVSSARNVTFQYGNLPPNVLGSTDPLGNITIAPGLPAQVEAQVIRHESVHAFLSPGPGPLQQTRANVLAWGYQNSAFLRYTEEALAQGYATRSMSAGLAFPITHGYVTPLRLGIEVTVGVGVTGAGAYGSYELLK